MNKLAFVSILAAILIAPLPVQADHRNHAGYDRHEVKPHHMYDFDRHGYRHKHKHKYRPHARVAHRGKHYVHPHHRGNKYGHYYGSSRHDDGGHWGIVIRYFD